MNEGEDYYFNDAGLMIFTKAYHLKRGYCCKNKCLNCPWNYGKRTANGRQNDQEMDVDQCE
ncbi:MAG: hypothetical protein EOO89_14040 [Pedobacter sp.]|nr:MAG: hypothetical protein EOO89_14040 [Pedobacter sp.]